jgi:hypothetical protein
MGRFDKQRERVKSLITKYGELLQYSNYDEEAVNEVTPWKGKIIEPIIYTVSVAFFSTNSDLRQLFRFMSNGQISVGNETGYMASVDFRPTLKDTLVRKNGDIYRIKNINVLDPNGDGAILYTFEFQR